MKRYTEQEKAEALSIVNEIGVAKTAEQQNISVQTLYKWKREAQKGKAAPSTAKMDVNKAAAKYLDDDKEKTIKALTKENAELKTQVAGLESQVDHLKTMLRAIIDKA